MISLVLFILPTALLVLLAYFFYIRKAQKDMAKAETLRQAYEKALNSGNKAAALRCGRAYFEYLRGGRLTIYDEQSITNDLAAMG